MNIFALSNEPFEAAEYHCDKHVVKMCVEYTQIICTVLRMKGIEHQLLYKRTHEAHPCVVWAAINEQNFNWLCKLAGGLFAEFEKRYSKQHGSYNVFDLAMRLFSMETKPLFHETRRRIPFVKCMPACYKASHTDPVYCYRLYYVLEKRAICRWKNGLPEWVGLFVQNIHTKSCNGYFVPNTIKKGATVWYKHDPYELLT